MVPEYTKVATTSDLQDGEMIPVAIGEQEILLARIDGEYFAIDNVCSHFRALLTDGELHAEACEVQCPLHDSCFDLRTGIPKDLPADEPVSIFSVRVEGESILVCPARQAVG
jgi:3-phenylpropionate/trans-cinnamate dioxygenase ferredoxin subunit